MIIADLHLHSKHSRATSKNLSFDNLEKYGRIKGLGLLGTGDFQHPLQFEAIKNELIEDDKGILWTKNKFPFLLQTEISLMFSNEGRRAVHLVMLAPNLEIAEQIQEKLLQKGRIDYDGRPIFGLMPAEFVEMMKEISDKIEIIPAHCMTPWFGIFGSKSGFDTVKDCFEDKAKEINAIETGLSADPEMLWRNDDWNKLNLISTSDAHSFWPWRLGREATIFEGELSYDNILKAIRTGEGLKETIEVDPGYGKYHIDGHRNCGVSFEPKETSDLKKICPKCGKELVIGVLNRVEELANHEEGYRPSNAKEFKRLIPLQELIGSVYGIKQLSSVRVWKEYDKLIKEFGNEFNILLKVSFENLSKVVNEKLARVILLNREGKIRINPGFDGIYGTLFIDEKYKIKTQTHLNQF
ncbi:MAG: DNA helicase UvrD [Nanoarchaeota archaeon]|jgi:uncharacterized protein (TIGR00375 family)|nr:DNA helicase UvrD [Nanoarchaeota archaeon]|tara:strand:- start:17183 stop:18415 length:1233 start_codon:yes stop_codon:yes gene_type:complete